MCKLKISKPSGETSGGRSDKPRRMGVSGKGDAGRASNVWQSDGEPGDVGAPSPTPQQHQQATTRASAPLLEQVEMMPHSPVRPTGAKQKRKTTDKGDQAPMPRSGESSVRGQALHSHSPADNRSSTTKSREPSPLVDKSSVVPASAGKMTCAACGRATSIETSVGKIVHNTNNTSRFKFFKGKYKTSWNLQNTTNHPRYCLRDDCCYEAWCVYTGGGRTEADQLPRRTASMLLERLVNESTEAWFSRSLAAALLAGADAADMEGKEDTDDERTRVEEVPEEAEVDSDDFSSVEPDFHGEGDRHPRRKVVDEEWEMHEQELEMGEALDEESVYDDGDDALNDMMEDEDPPDDYSSDDDDDPKSDFGDD
jgi:hypothetical protein